MVEVAAVQATPAQRAFIYRLVEPVDLILHSGDMICSSASHKRTRVSRQTVTSTGGFFFFKGGSD